MLFDKQERAALNNAVQACGTLSVGLWPKQHTEFLQALASHMGGPVDSVDAFVTKVHLESVELQHNVMWLRGRTIGVLSVRGSGSDNDPPELRGWVRPLSQIRELTLETGEFYWQPGTDVLEEVRPTVIVRFFDGVEVKVAVGGRPNDVARTQAADFIDCLKKALAAE